MTLKQLRKAQCLAQNEKWCDNVASSLFGLKRQRGEDGTEELVDALDSKYSELKEKLFIELLKEYGILVILASSICKYMLKIYINI